MEEKKLNLGCGKDIKKGFVNLDCVKLKGVDVIHNLDKFPWPFKKDEFAYIEANHILEHLEDIPKVLKETWKITKNKGIIKIKVPHYASSSAWSDLTHKHPFGWMSLDYMAKNKVHKHSVGKKYAHEYAQKEKFNIKRRLNFGKLYKFIGIESFANKFPVTYEMYLAYIFPPREIQFSLEVVK